MSAAMVADAVAQYKAQAEAEQAEWLRGLRDGIADAAAGSPLDIDRVREDSPDAAGYLAGYDARLEG